MRDQEKSREQPVEELEGVRFRLAEIEGDQTIQQLPDDALTADDILGSIDFAPIQSLMDVFYKLTGIGIAILNLDGDILVATGWQDICVKFHRVNPETRENCIESDLELSANVREGEYRLYKCKNNMWDMATPIFIAGVHVCNLYLGQFLFEGETPDRATFELQAERYGFDKDEYLAALDRVPKWDRDKVDTVMTFYSRFASLFGHMSYGNVKLARALENQRTLADSLRQNRNMLKTILSASPVGIAHTRDRIIRWTNDTWLQMFGFQSEQECMGRSVRIIYPSDEEFEKIGQSLYPVIEDTKVRGADAIFLRKDGSTFDGHIRLRAVESDGSTRGHIASISDVSDRKTAERKIRLSEERLELAIEGARLGMWDLNLVTGRAVINRRTAEIIGCTLDEVNPTIDFWMTIIHPDDMEKTLELFDKHLQGITDFFEHEYRVRAKDREYRWVLARGRITERNGLGKAIRMAGIYMDTTEMKEVQREKENLYEQLLQSQKMEALGTLVSGIAHDFNNMLQIILGYTQMLMLDREQDDKDYRDLRNILVTAQQQADLVKRMLQFARKAPVNLAPLNLNDRVTDLANVIFKTFPRMIDLRLDLDPRLKNVMADQIQMDQAIVNLAINARDSMPSGGSLTITTRNMVLGYDSHHANHGLKPGSYITLRISDTGVGISEDHLKRIFEPFFSTKQRGSDRGTGLGLSVVKGIVEQHGGTVTCESALGEGTQFSVFLPCIGE